ncbi:MerR family DNA-binding protein [Pannus brasiliensis CCIBt3594]|uniref:MerR family DNA-binding protein n=1 Tax=Pannus brasiliensis CCIBt3594 TaxID=1427578 RepID=A0AAW9QTG1_9CHRO
MSSALADHLKIGRLSIESGVPIKTIRYYEELGLIRSDGRTEGQFRLFRPDTVNRLLFIKRLQTLGLSLQQIRDCLSVHERGELPCEEIKEKLEGQIREIDRQVEQLLLLRQQLTETFGEWEEKPRPDERFICPNLKI